ncbi:hypothetical protein JCM21900_001880 [Sporobolomyces salmonicolor]
MPTRSSTPFAASTSTASSAHDRSNPLAFLSAKPYLTTIRDIMPQSPFHQLAGFSFTSSVASSSSSGPVSHSAATTPTFDSPSPNWDRRSSYASTASSSDTSDDELETPPTSPQVVPLSDPKGKGRADEHHHHLVNLDDPQEIAPFSLLEVAEDEDARGHLTHWPSSTSPYSSVEGGSSPASLDDSISSSSSSDTIVSPPLLASSAVPLPQVDTRPPPQPSPPTRAQEEHLRGRSRWPRLLWRSNLDDDSLDVLKSYHERAVGGPLPLLKREMRGEEVRRWSRRMEDAGL